MAKNTTKKPAGTSSEKATGKSKIFGLLSTSSSILNLGAISILFAGLYDFGYIDLTHTLSKFAVPALLVLILSSLLGVFASSKINNQAASNNEKELAGFQSRLKTDIATVEEKVSRYLGDGYEQLKAENDEFKRQIEEAKEQRQQNLEEEIEVLKTKNEELHDQIGKMAKSTNESSIYDDRLDAA